MDEWNGGSYGAFFAAQELAEDIGILLTVPRCASRQTARNNEPSDFTVHVRTTDALCGTLTCMLS